MSKIKKKNCVVWILIQQCVKVTLSAENMYYTSIWSVWKLILYFLFTGNPSEVFPITVTSIERQRMINDNLGIISAALQNVGSTQPSILPIGSVAVFNCTAFESFPPPTIRWCLRRSTEHIFRNFAYASAQRVDRVNSSFPDRSCFYTTTSLLPFVISDSDNGTTLSCSTNTEECTSRSSRSFNEMTFTIVTSGN